MRDIRKTDQGGSVASIVVIGVILAALLIGSIFIVKQRGDSARRQQAISEYDKQQAEKNQPESDQNEALEQSADGSNNGAVESSTDTIPTDNLPNTGPESSITDALGVFLLTVSIFSYFSSKRYILRHL